MRPSHASRPPFLLTPLPLLLLLLLLLLLHHLPTPTLAKPWSPSDLPSPQSDPKGICGHKSHPSSICDPDHLLPSDAVATLDGLINFIAAGTHGFATAPCGRRQRGFQVAVAVLRRMSPDARPADQRAARFARRLHDAWGVGDAECNNGVVLLVAVDDRRVHISAGAAAKARLHPRAVQAVLARMKPALRAARVADALRTGVADIGHVLAGDATLAAAAAAADGAELAPNFFDYLVFLFVSATFCLGACGRSASSPREQYRNCHHALRRLEEDRSAARRSAYEGQKSCPICLEEFEKRSPPPSRAASPAPAVLSSPAASQAERAAAAAASSSLLRQTTSAASASASAAAAAAAGGTPPADGAGDGEGDEEGRALLARADEQESGDGTAEEAEAGATGGAHETEQVLRCGHKFHKLCLQSMLQNSMDKCPVCRRPMFGPDPSLRRPPGAGGAGGSGAGSSSSHHRQEDDDCDLRSAETAARGNVRRADWNAFYPEYMFRLNRMNLLYPRYVTTDMVHRWGNEGYQGPLAADSQFRALEPRVVEAARASGSGGSSFSFGGGGSSGGGGGGSSW